MKIRVVVIFVLGGFCCVCVWFYGVCVWFYGVLGVFLVFWVMFWLRVGVLLERLERGLLSLLCCAGVDEGEKKRVYTVVYTRGGGRLVTACAVL